MRCAYIDCFSGVAGDMLLAALLDAGLDENALRSAIERLGLPGVSLNVETVQRHGIAAKRAIVGLPSKSSRVHRHLPQIERIIRDAALPARATENALRVFHRLAVAEAAVHGTTPEKVHFHEVGADDAIVDIVGVCYGLHALGVDEVVCSPIPPGGGFVDCEHGRMPVPAPATAQLLRGAPLASCDEPGELATPTGAAIVVTLASSFGTLPAMRLEHVGVGAGARVGKTRPNLLRVLLGERAAGDDAECDSVAVIECQIDDASGEALAFAAQQMLAAGALDAYLVPIIMKKGRPGHLLTVLARPADARRLADEALLQTSTFGVRYVEARRTVLAREHASVETAYGPIRIKVGRRGASVIRAAPEYEDCAAAARRHGKTFAAVWRAAQQAWEQTRDDPGAQQ